MIADGPVRFLRRRTSRIGDRLNVPGELEHLAYVANFAGESPLVTDHGLFPLCCSRQPSIPTRVRSLYPLLSSESPQSAAVAAINHQDFSGGIGE